MIKFSVARLEKEPIELTGSEPAEFLEIEPGELLAVSAPVEYDLNLKAVSGGALVEGQVSTELSGICGRCLEPVTRHVKNDSICLFLELGDQDEMDISEEIRAEMLRPQPGLRRQPQQILLLLGRSAFRPERLGRTRQSPAVTAQPRRAFSFGAQSAFGIRPGSTRWQVPPIDQIKPHPAPASCRSGAERRLR